MWKWGFIALALLVPLSQARANTRWPQSVGVHLQRGSDQTILLNTTFGLLISRDRGATFAWVCEEAIGYSGMYDPDYGVVEDGSIFATTFNGLRVSRDGGCTWETIAGPLENHFVEDIDLGPGGEIWVSTASNGMPNNVYRSTDNGQTFVPRNLEHTTAWWSSIKVAPSDGQRLYVAGYFVAQELKDGGVSEPRALFYRSDDGGASWQELALTGVQFGDRPRFMLLGIDPNNADVVFGRAVDANGYFQDAVYRSRDAGQSWTKVLETSNTVTAFVARRSGDIILGTATCEETTPVSCGVFRSSNGGDSWDPPSPSPQMACITETQEGELLACGANWAPDFFALGRSANGVSWQKIHRFSEIVQPYGCLPGTVQSDLCEVRRWPILCEQLGCNQTDNGNDAGAADARPSGPPPTGGGGGGGSGGGCCDAGSDPGSAAVLAALVASVLWFWPWMRRRRGKSGA